MAEDGMNQMEALNSLTDGGGVLLQGSTFEYGTVAAMQNVSAGSCPHFGLAALENAISYHRGIGFAVDDDKIIATAERFYTFLKEKDGPNG